MSSRFKILTDKEVNRFNSVIKRYGFSKEDFEIVENGGSTNNEDDNIINNDIKVIRKSSGMELNFDIDYKSTWLAEFEDDLKHGAFGQIDV